MIVVGQAQPSDLAEFMAGRSLPFEVFCDPDQQAYAAYGLVRGTLWQVTLSPEVIGAGLQAFQEGHRVSGIVGDAMQLPGSFVIDRGTIVFAHKGTTSSDLTSPEDLIAAAQGT